MEVLQELIVTAFVALVFSFLVAKLVSIASSSVGDTVVDKKIVVEEVKLDNGLKTKTSKSKKKVKFSENVMIKKIDRFEMEDPVEFSELMIYNDYDDEEIIEECCGESEACNIQVADKIGGLKIEEKSECEKLGERAHQLEGEGEKKSLDVTDRAEELVKEVFGDTREIGDVVDGGNVSQNNLELVGKSNEKEVVVESFEDKMIVGLCDTEERVEADADLGGLVVEEKTKNQGVVDDQDGEEQMDNEEGGGLRVSEGKGIVGSGNEEEIVGEKDGDDDDDGWEGIERSELEKAFAEAVNYVECGRKGKDDQKANFCNDMQMELYGLQKIALEGPCHEPQPMALMVSARTKWNAWQRLGGMNPEVAMEQYIKLLSDSDPGWSRPNFDDDAKERSPEVGVSTNPDSNLDPTQDIRPSLDENRTRTGP